jgi:ornithine cyclodeaminase
MEGSIISAQRTAASAALAARTLTSSPEPRRAALVGCGPINFEVARFLAIMCPAIEQYTVFDIRESRSKHFRDKWNRQGESITIDIAASADDALASAQLISFATTAKSPHVFDISMCAEGTTILHLSLRDLGSKVILASDNIVDDVDHVFREQTSIHLAGEEAGNRSFVRSTLGRILHKRDVPRRESSSMVIFSPFGLGILDIAVGSLVYELALEEGKGSRLQGFFPFPWRVNTD